jgi:uncharacterized protein DUF2470
MRPSPAEVVRTLIAARQPGQLHLPEAAWPVEVEHATEPDGTPLLLVEDAAPGAAELPAAGADDVAALLTIPDVTPYEATPSRGEAVLLGWVAPLSGAAARSAADAFAAVRPLPALLDVGRGRTLYRMDLAEIRLDAEDRTAPVDPDAYRRARPDALRLREADLLADLNDHHPEIHAALLGWARAAVPTATAALPVRLDRHGLLLRVTTSEATGAATGDATRHLRLAFRAPATNLADLAATLHQLCCHRCPCERARP